MKQRPKERQKDQTREASPVPERRDSSRYSGRNRWILRLMAATIVPFFLIGFLELGLRVVGYGYSTNFFLPSEIAGKEFLIPNRKFTYRFFPPALARDPLPSPMLADKPEETFRIFLMGESAAYGDPDPSFGMGRYLEALLETRYPATNFEVVCVAITAINSHVILPIARECAKKDGDMWIVYMGNNEMVGPYGAGTVFGQKAPPLWFVRTALAVKKARIGQLLESLIGGLRRDSSAPEKWAGIDMFSNNQLRPDDAVRLRAYENFKGNLYDILNVGRRTGVPVILSTVGSNLKHCSPFTSLHMAGLEGSDLIQWETLFQEGQVLEAAGAFQAALELYIKADAIDPTFAELQFRIATCSLALADTGPAMQAFERARDLDALAVRADTRINEIILEAIDRFQGPSLSGIDAASLLAEQVPDGILGRETFYEHVHFTVEGNFRLARLLAGKVAEKLPLSATATGRINDADSEFQACSDKLAFSLWDRKRVWNVALERISTPPFTSQSSHQNTSQFFEAKMLEVDKRTTRSSWAEVRGMYESALSLNPDDTLVRWNYAQFLERSGSISEAILQGEQICRRIPHAPWPHYFVGSLLAKQGRMREAVQYLRAALRIQPDLEHAQVELKRIVTRHPSALK